MKRIVNAIWRGDGSDGSGTLSAQREYLITCHTPLKQDLKMKMVLLVQILKSL